MEGEFSRPHLGKAEATPVDSCQTADFERRLLVGESRRNDSFALGPSLLVGNRSYSLLGRQYRRPGRAFRVMADYEAPDSGSRNEPASHPGSCSLRWIKR